jgi:AcrR family transcriptional regulator
MAAAATTTDETHAQRQRIICAAEPLFLRQGYSKVTMAEIAAILGMSKKTIYQHFPGKEALFLAVIDAFFAELQIEIDAILADPRTPFVAKLRRFLMVMGTRVGRVQSYALQDVKRTMPRGWQRMEEQRRRTILTRLASLLRSGQAEGMVRPDLNRALLVAVLLALAEQIGTPEALAHADVTPADAFHTITTVFFEGILTDAARADLKTE